ncbi:MAG: glycosyltransferase [Acidobacteria bacterium]|nr:glycosyltransferase [Acidobacteriota bacterium]
MKIGIYNRYINALGGGEKRTLALAEHLSHRHTVSLIVPYCLDKPFLEGYFNIDLGRVRVVVLDSNSRSGLPHRGSVEAIYFNQIKAMELDLLINNSHQSHLMCPASRGIYMCMFPHQVWGSPLEWKTPFTLLDSLSIRWKSLMSGQTLKAVNSYDVVTANSQFTGHWIKRRWKRQSEVVYSVCERMAEDVDFSQKKPVILNVGRFIGDPWKFHHKRQDVLLEAFKRFHLAQCQGWELHFAGSRPNDAAGHEFLETLIASANGFPVQFHPGIPFEALRQLYRTASIYWHATGYGCSAEAYPERQEHFGVTTVEAMSAGLVPVVINSGGQRESVRHQGNGFLWNDLDEMIELTQSLILDRELRERLGVQAATDSKQFCREAFLERMDRILERLTT